MFSDVLKEMQALHDKKNADYGTQADPFANVRASEKFGIPPWMGAVIRLNDKVNRIASFAKNGRLENESIRDSLIDIAVYGAIAVALYDEVSPENKGCIDEEGHCMDCDPCCGCLTPISEQ